MLQEEGQDLIEYLNHDIRIHVIECQQFPICQSVCRWHKAEIVTITEFQNYILNIVEFLKLSCVLLSYNKCIRQSTQYVSQTVSGCLATVTEQARRIQRCCRMNSVLNEL